MLTYCLATGRRLTPISSSSLQYIQCCNFSVAKLQRMEYPKREYEGPSCKPSINVQIAAWDNSIWHEFETHPTDIYVSTPAKAGTTWTQELLSKLLYDENMQNIHDISPWLALAILPRDEILAQLQQQLQDANIPRRVIKTHEPVEAIAFDINAKYIFVGRDFRDIVWSMYNHHALLTDTFYEMCNAPRNYAFRPFPKFNFEDGSFTQRDLFYMKLTEADDSGNPDGWPWWSQLWITGSWWNVRDLPNVKLIHYNNLKQDLAGSMRSIAEFCEICIDENMFDRLVEACTFEAMKQRKVTPMPTALDGVVFKDHSRFLHKGEIGRWQNVLAEEDTELYRTVARRYLDDDGIRWMETGRID